MNIFTDINVAAVEAEFKKFSDMNKGIIDLIPAAVEAVKQETVKKMKLFDSVNKTGLSEGRKGIKDINVEQLTQIVVNEVKRYMSI